MLRKRYRAGPFMRKVLRPLTLAILVLSLLIGIISLIKSITLDQRWAELVPLLFLVILEAIYTTKWLRHPDRLRLDRTAYRGAELLLIFIVVRLASWVTFEEGVPDTAQLLGYLENPLGFFLNGHFVVSLGLAIVAWRLAVLLSSIFSHLEVSEFELRYYSMPLAQRKARADDQPIQTGRRQLVSRFVSYWIWGGVLLAVTIGLSSLDIRSYDFISSPLALGGSGLEENDLVVLLLYFGLGFWLLSQAKLMGMNARWLVNGINTEDQIERNWQRSSLIILLLVALIAAFLPTGPTLAISRLLSVLIYVVLFLANLLVFLITMPIALILALFSRRPIADIPPPAPFTPQDLVESAPPALSSLGQTIAMVLSSAFWSIFIVILILAFWFFLRERRNGLQGKSAAAIWQQFLRLLSEIWQWLRHRMRVVRLQFPVQFIREGSDKTAGGGQKRWRFFRLGGLSPREQIRYFYLSTVRRAGERGVERDLTETPLEYAEELKESWPEVDAEVEELTAAFLKARYSDNPITGEDIPQIKETWKDVRRQIRKPPDAIEDDAGKKMDGE